MSSRDERVSRRDFLAGVGRSVGGSAMLRVMAALGLGGAVAGCGSSSAASSPPPGVPPPPPPPSGSLSPRPGDWPANVGTGRSVVILGAGIAGLTAALELTRLGYACTVLEATARAGGRTRTLRAGDLHDETGGSQLCQFDLDPTLYFNPGPARIPHHHEFLLGYCREFGVQLETFVNENRAGRLQSPATFGGAPQLARRVHSDTRGYIAELLSTAISQDALNQELSGIDRTRILGMLRTFGDLDGNNRYAGSRRSGFPGQEDAGSRQRDDLLPPLALADLVQESFWQDRLAFAEALDQQPTMLQPVGGMDRISEALAGQVQQHIIYSALVREIRKSAGGASIVYRDSSGTDLAVDADFCLCTIPATVLRDIPGDFSAGHAQAIAGFAYAPAVKTAFQSRRFWERDHNVYGGVSWTTQDITQLWYPNHDFGAGQGVLLGSYIFGGAAGASFSAMTPQQRIDATLAQAEAVHPGVTGEAGRGLSVAWSEVPFQLGAWGVSSPGVLTTPDDALFLAGEHLSTLQGWQEGAIQSAYRAIDDIVSRS